VGNRPSGEWRGIRHECECYSAPYGKSISVSDAARSVGFGGS
jgi:hypothetical protein